MESKIFSTEKNIVILGFGREGQSTYKFIRATDLSRKLTIRDKKPFSEWDSEAQELIKKDSNCQVVDGETYLSGIEPNDLIIKTPGIPHKLPEISKAREEGVEITSQTKIFFELAKGKVIGVTGTKGKSTTASLIAHILSVGQKKAVLMGNVGKPVLDYLSQDSKDTIFVFEMSSHQLSDSQRSPQIAVFLNIFREHLDYYNSFEEYLAAKERITKFQSEDDTFIYNQDVPELLNIANRSKARKLSFSQISKTAAYLFQKSLYLKVGAKDELIIKTSELSLLGAHNVLNVLAAAIATYALGVSLKDLREGIRSFKPLANRLEDIGTYKGIRFICDALATIPEATIAAISAFQGATSTLICGGYDRGQDFSELVKVIVDYKVRNLILFPTTGQRILDEVKKTNNANLPDHYFVDNMDDAVKIAYRVTPKDTVCLLSAASPSFSVFSNYEQEAQLYKEAVLEFAKAN